MRPRCLIQLLTQLYSSPHLWLFEGTCPPQALVSELATLLQITESPKELFLLGIYLMIFTVLETETDTF